MKKIKELFINAFKLRDDSTFSSTNIIMNGKTRLFIENYRNIIEYTDTSLKIQGKCGKIFITGKALYIESYDADMMFIKGIFTEIKYI